MKHDYYRISSLWIFFLNISLSWRYILCMVNYNDVFLALHGIEICHDSKYLETSIAIPVPQECESNPRLGISSNINSCKC